MTPTTSSIQSRAKANGCDPTLGHVCYWRMDNSRITPDDLRAVILAENLGIVVPDIDQPAAVKSVAQGFQYGRGNKERHYAQVVHLDNSTIDIAIVAKRVDENAPKGSKAKPVQIECITYDCGSNTWMNQPTTDCGFAVIAACDTARTFLDHNFIRGKILEPSLASLAGFRLKSGVYWIAETDESTKTRASLKRILAHVNECRFISLKVDAGDAESMQEVQIDGRETLATNLDELMSKLAEWTAGASGRRPRKDAVEQVINGFAQLKREADLFQGMLEVSITDLAEVVEQASAEARKLLDDESDEWRASPGLVRAYEWLIESAIESEQVEDGVIIVTAEDLADANKAKMIPASAIKHGAYYSRSNGGGKALGHLGYRGTLREGILSLRPLAAKATQTVTPISDAEPTLEEKLATMTQDDLDALYSQVCPSGAQTDPAEMRSVILDMLAADAA